MEEELTNEPTLHLYILVLALDILVLALLLSLLCLHATRY